MCMGPIAVTLTAATYKISVNESETITDAQTIGGANGRRQGVAEIRPCRAPMPLWRPAAVARNLERS
jgi:hypothetical protein